jgi:hypothetical protein
VTDFFRFDQQLETGHHFSIKQDGQRRSVSQKAEDAKSCGGKQWQKSEDSQNSLHIEQRLNKINQRKILAPATC